MWSKIPNSYNTCEILENSFEHFSLCPYAFHIRSSAMLKTFSFSGQCSKNSVKIKTCMNTKSVFKMIFLNLYEARKATVITLVRF